MVDAVAILTEWKEFTEYNWQDIISKMKNQLRYLMVEIFLTLNHPIIMKSYKRHLAKILRGG